MLFPLHARYLLGRTVRVFAAAFLVVLSVLLMERLIRLLDLFINYAPAPLVLLKMLANLVPHYTGLGLPAAFFIAVLVVMLSMRRDNELDALEAGGLSLAQLTMPLLALALGLMLIALSVASFIGPNARYGYRELVHLVKNTSIVAALAQRRTFTLVDGRMLYVERWSDTSVDPFGVVLHEERRDGFTTLTAKEGKFLQDETGQDLYLQLFDGNLLSQRAGEDGAPRFIAFDRMNIPLKRGPSPQFRARGGDQRELTLSELWRARETPPVGLTRPEIEAELSGRLVRVFSILFLPLLAASLTRASPRRSNRIVIFAGVLMLIAYNYILQLGQNLTESGKASSTLAIWGPAVLFAAFTIVAFYRASTRISAPVEIDPIDFIRRRLLRRRIAEGAAS